MILLKNLHTDALDGLGGQPSLVIEGGEELLGDGLLRRAVFLGLTGSDDVDL